MPDFNTNRGLKILMLATFPFFSYRGTPIAVKSRLDALSKLGHQVDVITYHVGSDFDLPGIKIHRTINIPFIKEVPIGPSLKKIFLDTLVCFKTVHFLVNRRYDLIYTHEEANYFGSIFSKVFKIRHLLDFHGSIPQIMINLGYGRLRPLIYVLEKAERWVINSSHGLIPNSPDLYAYVRKINDKIPTVIIEDSQNYDFSSIDQERLDSFKLSHPELDGKNIVLYTGTFELYQGLELLLASAELVLKKGQDIIFVLVGGRQDQVDALKESAEKRGIASRIHFISGNFPMDEIALYMSISNVLISARTVGNNPPLKIYDYLRAGKPIVATNVNAHTQILNDDIAVLVDPDPEFIAKGIVSVIENPEYAKTLGQRSREFFENNYSIEKKIEKTRQILDAVMREKI